MSDVPPEGDQLGRSNPSTSQPPPPGDSGQGHGGQGAYAGSAPAQPSNGIGIAAMVVGIVALLLCWIPFLGLVLAIVALVLGIVGIRKASRGEATNKGMAITGVVTGGLALLGGILSVLFFLFIAEEFGSLIECLDQAQTVEEERDCQTQFEDDFNR